MKVRFIEFGGGEEEHDLSDLVAEKIKGHYYLPGLNRVNEQLDTMAGVMGRALEALVSKQVFKLEDVSQILSLHPDRIEEVR